MIPGTKTSPDVVPVAVPGTAPTALTLSVAIPTYGRDAVLVDTIAAILRIGGQTRGFKELIVVDQTAKHEAEADAQLATWDARREIRWLRLPQANLTRAMNLALCEAGGEIVLFLDDDIVPSERLLTVHLESFAREPGLTAVVGQILQPGEEPEAVPYQPTGDRLRRYMDFPFRSTEGCFIENAMAGNLSVRRDRAMAIGGFDESFGPPVASRFESEFAKRLVDRGGLIWFEPAASIRHLRAPFGGTRAFGSHLTSALPCFGVGDYYFALRVGRGWNRWWYILRKPFREVRTRFHLRHPWWIPVKLIGEVRALLQALRLAWRPPELLGKPDCSGGGETGQ
jgi:glycosyltransferase involved in cell wall biosynthesis